MTESAAAESALWGEAVRPLDEQRRVAVFSTLARPEHALALETIYEGYLAHFGRSRLFAPADDETALLLGDYLYAHGLVRIADTGDVDAVTDLSELISLCGHARAEGLRGDGAAWAATAARLGAGGLDEARDSYRELGEWAALERIARTAAGDAAVGECLAAHASFV
jgi:hypothetical protein